ncbi:chemotaxis protein CheD [Paucidesulfovibrio gracilis DSM 16080]|uniref:Probable chemoreceptor glutamine deamidase CheD n=1 Tax=Paucidesulfovibrio gracilis DSM 16080 TaxID=1121449 RepID=A0A1T4XWQ1_9BACT|nr:chemotaxis protein CheD [Paucidesulfovibrio gracilis]SKA93833.1 chemotaxis protein CheD [Paucidesulfovibrio gracilis DSM 16080]
MVLKPEPRQLVVSISDMKYSVRPEEMIVTYSLGSCLGITAYDPGKRIGAMMHALLPNANASPEKAARTPYMFVTVGFRAMVARLENLGAVRRRLVIKAAGGSDMRGDNVFRTGERNTAALHQVLQEERLRLTAQEVGGTIPRTMFLHLDSGEVVIKTFGKRRNI